MIKKLLIPILFLYSINSQAQDFTGGLIAGFTTSQVNGDGVGGFYKFGPTAGFFVQRDFSQKFDGIFELRFTQKGSGDGLGNLKINLGYIELPFIVRYKTQYKFGVKFGIAPAIKIYEKTTYNLNKEVTSDFWVWDTPIHIGVDYPLTEKLTCDVRYSFSTIPVSWQYMNCCLYFALHYNLKK